MQSQLECKPIYAEHLANCHPEQLLWMFQTMNLIRLAEEKIADLVAQNEIICPCHLYIGQEAVATGVCASLRKSDYVFSTHRSHGHYLAKGGDLRTMMAELYGRITGCSRGKGGSMHLVDAEVGFPGSSAIVAGTIPLAVGTALGFRLQHRDNVAVAFFGDGATNEGTFYESINFASLKKLPVIFVCENNLYSTHMPIADIQADPELFKKVSVFNMRGVRIDGNNLGEVFVAAQEAIERARNGQGPTLIECLTYRWRGHVGPNWDIEKGLRTQEEVDWWVKRCSLKRFEEYLLERGLLSSDQIEALIQKLQTDIEEAVQFAKESPFPDHEELYKYVFK